MIDDGQGISFENINSPDPVFEVNDFDNLLEENLNSSNEELLPVVIDEIEEEEILISIDII